MTDLTTAQWARLLDAGTHVRVTTESRVVYGRVDAVRARSVSIYWTGRPVVVERRRVQRVARLLDGGGWRRVRSRERSK